MPWERPQSGLLPDGRRLHLNHGPIDLIVEVFGGDRNTFYRRAVDRFETILEQLAVELTKLRRPLSEGPVLGGPVARRMLAALTPLSGRFVTPMAAVAGAVADEMLAVMLGGVDVSKAYVNNGGDIAFHLGSGARFDINIAAKPVGHIVINSGDTARGVASSGWRGRSHSLGIADSVTVLARNTAAADVAATLIANETDLPGHPAVHRTPANELAPDSDLGDRPVTTAMGQLLGAETTAALDRGTAYAEKLLAAGAIDGAVLMLNDAVRWVTHDTLMLEERMRCHG